MIFSLEDIGGEPMKFPKITQNNFRMLLPAKIAMTVEMIAKHEQIMPIKAMVNFYHSRTYSSLEKEATKFWWMSPLQLFREYEREMEEV